MLLATAEILHGLASGFYHPLGYFALCAALAIGSSAALDLACRRIRVLRPHRAAIWSAAAISVIQRGRDGILAGLGTLLICRLFARAKLGARAESIAAAGAIAWCLLLFPALAAMLGPRAERLAGETTGIALAYSAALITLLVAARALAPLGPPLKIALLCAFALVPLLAPALTAPSIGQTGAPVPPAAPAAADGAPSILVLVLDTVGVRQLSLYGYGRPTFENTEAFLRTRSNAVVFPLAFATSPWTVPSHASLVTGLVQSDHGAGQQVSRDTQFLFQLDAPVTLPERLRQAGYRTVAVFANRLDLIRGFERGFDVFYRPYFPEGLGLLGEKLRSELLPGVHAEARKPYPEAERVTRAVLREVEACGARPCFVLVNYLDAHLPYLPPPPCRGRFGGPWSPFEEIGAASVGDPAERIEHLRARHDEEICGLDRSLADLLARLEASGFLERAWVFITSDHGESFGEHGVVEHGTSLYNEQTQIPLVVLPPVGRALATRAEAVGLLDVTATVAEIAGVAPLGAGRSLLLPGGSSWAPMEFFGNPAVAALKGALAAAPARAAAVGHHKLVELEGRRELYDLRDDPREKVDLAAGSAALAERLARGLPPLRRGSAPDAAKAGHLSARDREALRALGYLE